ncbi:hypothetical protein CN998_21915 [Bacillus cereus]|nr:hypothetical protein CN998_21915 [Bacillus cereus]
MSFFRELIDLLSSSGIGLEFLMTTLLTLVTTTVVNLIQIKLKKNRADSEMVITFNQIISQRNVKQEKSKVRKSLSNYIASMLAMILISEIIKTMEKARREKYKSKATAKLKYKNRLIISALFLESKLKKIYKAYFTIGLGSILLLVISFYFVVPLYVNVIPLFFAILTCSYQFLLNYRIKNGLFGTNDYEAKELLEFIIQNNDKINGNKLFNEEVVSNTIIDFSNYVKKVHLLNEH